MTSADPRLLYVTGFDANTRQFQYQVNPKFGTTRPNAVALYNPFRITLDVSIEMTREEPHSFSVTIPGRLTANPLDLVFLVESPESPADIIGSDDRRKLGFFISSIRVFTDE